jgi:hypothetical protein
MDGPRADAAPTSEHDPLSGLDEVPWDRLHHAYGAAVDVPGQLRALRSPDEQVRARARWHLYGNIYHQGTRWQASHHAVPFLAALAADGGTPDRAAVMALLRAVGIGDLRDDDLPLNVDTQFGAAAEATSAVVQWFVAVLYADDRDLDELPEGVDRAADARWRRDAYLAASMHTGTYRRLLLSPDVEVAALAAELLAWFPPEEATLAALVSVPADARHAMVRASANLTLAYLPGNHRGIEPRLHQQLTSDLPVVRLTAAVALAFRLGDALPEVAAEVLTEPASNDPVAAVPGWNRSLEGFVTLALRQADGSPRGLDSAPD